LLGIFSGVVIVSHQLQILQPLHIRCPDRSRRAVTGE
jgi:hypothetical protein